MVLRDTLPFDRRWALFLDVDGTLIDHADSPAEVQIQSELIDILARVAQLTQNAFALISGRALRDLDELFAPLRLPAAGQHGLEVRDASGQITCDTEAHTRNAIASRLLRERTHHLSGLLMEDKGLSVALHYRRAPYLRQRLERLTRALVAELGEPYQLIDGCMVFEIKAGRLDKGTAIEQLMLASPFKQRLPVYIGNDRTDEDAFAVVNARAGVTVRVGEGETLAQHRIARPCEVREWLKSIATAKLA